MDCLYDLRQDALYFILGWRDIAIDAGTDR